MHPLQDARNRCVPWPDIARLVRLLENEGVPSGTTETPIRLAERLSGYSANQIRRMLAGLDFLEELPEADPAVAEWLGTPRFSVAEMLGKLWRKDRDSTLQLLLGRPTLRYEGLYTLFHDLAAKGASPVAAGKRAGKQFRDQWLSSLTNDPGQLAPFGAGTYSIIRPRIFPLYCKPSLLLQTEISPSTILWAGLDFIDRPVWNDDAMWRRIMLVATESTFLHAWYLFVARNLDVAERDDATVRAARMVKDLGLRNVVVVPVVGGHPGDVGRFDPMPPPPIFDRRSHWEPPTLSTKLLQYKV